MDKNKILERIINLREEIAIWSSTNSQSNPGAYFHLRGMKQELKKLIESIK